MTVALLLACAAEEPPAAAPPLAVAAAPSPEVASVLAVSVDEPGDWTVVHDHAAPTSGTGLDVRGIPAGEEVSWWVEGVDAEGRARRSEPRAWVAPAAPAGFPELTIEVDGDPGFAWLAATLVVDAPERSALVVIDPRGRYVWWVEAPPGSAALTPEVRADAAGTVLGFVSAARDRDVDDARFVEVPLSGAWREETPLARGHHDVARGPDGELAWLAHGFAEIPTGGETLPMASDEVLVEGERLFSLFDDLPLEPEPTCDHVREEVSVLGRDVRSWTHGNSLLWMPEEDAWLVNARFTDWLLAIGRDGELRWVMNGRGGEFTSPDGAPVWRSAEDTDLWSHAHLSEAWSGGAMVFDNGDHHTPPRSRALEVAWDEATRTVETVWSREHPEGGQTAALGDVRRLDDGGVLVTWAGLGTIEVVDRDQTVRWRARLSRGMFARVLPLDGLR